MTKEAKREQREFYLFVASIFMLLIIPATIARMTGWRFRPWPPGANGYQSVFSETKRAAMGFAPYVFAGL